MDPLTPQENSPENKPDQDKNKIDISSILLPKKEVPGHTPDSAQRINAGALLEQEITAGSEGTHAQETPAQKAAEVKPAAAPAPLAPESEVKPIETFQRDIESVVQHDNVSVLSIATAEAKRRSADGTEGEPATNEERKRSLIWNVVMIAGGLIFLVGASGALAYLVTRTSSVPISTGVTPTTPFISVDAVKEITITPDEPRAEIMSDLDAARQSISLQLGLMSQLLVTESSTTASAAPVALAAQDFFTKIAPSIPAALARSLEPNYLLGVHVYNGNQAFVIANVDSYEDAYAGMLAWEPYMQSDLAPLFNYTPSPRIPEEGIATTSTGTADQFIQTGFTDTIVENHDARALINGNGDIYLLWTFLDRNTLVITTNDATLREIISRLQESPITPIPSQ